MLNNKKRIVAFAAATGMALAGFATMTGCSNQADNAANENAEEAVEAVEIAVEDVYDGQDTTKKITDLKDTGDMFVYLSGEESNVTHDEGVTDAVWHSNDNLTSYSFADVNTNYPIDDATAKGLTTTNDHVVLRIAAMIPSNNDMHSTTTTVLGQDVESYTEVADPNGDRAIGLITDENGNKTLITAERANGNGNDSFVVKVYINGTKAALARMVGTNANASDEEIITAFSNTQSWKHANEHE